MQHASESREKCAAEPFHGETLAALLLEVGTKELGLRGRRRHVESSAAVELAAAELLEKGEELGRAELAPRVARSSGIACSQLN